MSLLKGIIKNKRILLSFIGSIFFIYLSLPTYRSILIGIPFILFGEAIRTWASGFIKKDKELAQDGPYALTRNPLYLGSFFMGLGFSIMANNLYILVLFLAGFSFIYIVTIKNEEKRLSSKFGDIYSAYKRRVPVFFPIPRFEERRSFDLNFDWHLVIRHREHYTWLGIAGYLAVIILKSYIEI